MASFTSPSNFYGSYTGSYDGRDAQLVIGDLKDDSPSPSFHLRFTDLDRNEVYVGSHVETGQHGHILTNITLNKFGGGGSVTWSRLYLHTWNIAFLSGVSVWNNISFGMSFSRT